MKSKTIKFLIALTFLFVGALAADANAQGNWERERGYASSCSENGNCTRDYDTIELIPYGSNSSYQSDRPPFDSYGHQYDNRLRPLYQAGDGPYAGSQTGRSGGCGCCSGHVDPYSRRQFDDRRNGYDNRQPPYNPYQEGNEYRSGQEYSAPTPRPLESYQSTPADQPPRLSTPQSYAPMPNDAANNFRPFSNSFGSAPQASTQLMQTPLQQFREATDSRGFQTDQRTYQTAPQNLPQLLLPPTNSATSQPAPNDPTGHDHAGHDHAGHSH